MTDTEPAQTGRPTLYTTEIADEILELLCAGRSLRDVCRDERFPAESTVRLWALKDREGFKDKYSSAREIGYHTMADETLEIADDGRNDWMERQGEDDKRTFVLNGEHVQRSRLRVDTRKWFLSKVLPKIYGDKVALTGNDDGPLTVVIRKFSDA